MKVTTKVCSDVYKLVQGWIVYKSKPPLWKQQACKLPECAVVKDWLSTLCYNHTVGILKAVKWKMLNNSKWQGMILTILYIILISYNITHNLLYIWKAVYVFNILNYILLIMLLQLSQFFHLFTQHPPLQAIRTLLSIARGHA